VLSGDISDMELQITAYQNLLQSQFTNMETVINSLKTTGNTLTNALGQLPSFNGK
jgi:flagellar capping protein FliD